MEVVFVRHPQTVANQSRIFCSESDYPYTERGLVELGNMIKELHELDYAVYTSPYERALKVAQLIKNQPIIDQRIKEIDFGIFKGLSVDEVADGYPEDFEKFKTQVNDYIFPKGESYKKFADRISEFFDEIIQHGEDVIIVTHAGVINYLLQKYFKIKKYWPKTGSIIKLKISIEEEHYEVNN
jgi:broad specificity phosphatase PhoE